MEKGCSKVPKGSLGQEAHLAPEKFVLACLVSAPAGKSAQCENLTAHEGRVRKTCRCSCQDSSQMGICAQGPAQRIRGANRHEFQSMKASRREHMCTTHCSHTHTYIAHTHTTTPVDNYPDECKTSKHLNSLEASYYLYL